MLLRTRSFLYENFVFVIGQCHFKHTLIKSVLTKKKKNKQTKKLQPRIEPGLVNLTLPITSTLQRRHNGNQENLITQLLFRILSLYWVLLRTLVQIYFKKETLIFVLLFPISGGTTRTTFGSFQLQQTLLPGSCKEVRKSCRPNLFKAVFVHTIPDSFSRRNEI